MRTGTPIFLRLLLALAVPLVGALTVTGTYLGQEVVVTALWIAMALGAFLFIRPVVGIVAMTALFLLASYPELLQALGFLTVANLLGICFLVLVALHVLETRDLSFLHVRQVRILMVIGVLFLLGSLYSDVLFPYLQKTRGRGMIIDKTEMMAHNFVARLVFLMFFCIFVRSRSDMKAVYVTLMLALFLAVPSALWNMATGELKRGFRTVASVTQGSNANRLAMICLIQVGVWWFWYHARPTTFRRLVAMGVAGASMVVLMGTGSRSGLLGVGVLFLGLQTAERRFRVSAPQIGVMATAALVAILTVVPAASWQRMISFNPEKGESGASSNKMRGETVERAWEVVLDYPLLGVGLGNFREVVRQVYNDEYFRPPHNSYLWAASEGGVFVLAAYLWLFAVTWGDMRQIGRLSHRDPELSAFAGGLRIVFLLYGFFSVFADLWMAPTTYVLMGMGYTMRRYFEGLPEPAGIVIRPQSRLHRVAA